MDPGIYTKTDCQRHAQTKTDTDKDRHRERQAYRDINTHSDRQRLTDNNRHKDRHTKTSRQTKTHIHIQIDNYDRQTKTEDRDIQTRIGIQRRAATET